MRARGRGPTLASPAIGAALGLCLAAAAAAQDVRPLHRWYEQGRYQPIVDFVTPDSEPPVLFIAALAHRRLHSGPGESELWARLSENPDKGWSAVGVSGERHLAGAFDEALAHAKKAVAAAPGAVESHLQLGFARSRLSQWRGAAAAFDGARNADPLFAYAYYYAGLMHHRANRPDLMAIRFEVFLRLAPRAPERPEVEQIMRTVRGR
ncbi:MAG: hypothetical protein HY553_08060 [Elusimicrobia bacterium]|nr:hypothetical protein [Elusimicrobiota bacterium]